MSWTITQFMKDLGMLKKLIGKYDIPIDLVAISKLENYLQNKILTSDLNQIAYVIRDFEFIIRQSISSTIPVEVEEFNIYVDLNFIPDYSKDFSVKDPFFNDKVNFNDETIDAYTLQIEIRGHSLDNEYVNYWHLDRHITGGHRSKVIHPFYHFQNGGNKLEDNTSVDTGEILFTGAPRIPHPPMDIFLVFHFIINNFYNRNSFDFVDKLLSDDDYREIIKLAQKRIWEPYYNSFIDKANPYPEVIAEDDYKIANTTPLYTVH